MEIPNGLLYVIVDLQDPEDQAMIASSPWQSSNIDAAEFLEECHSACVKDLSWAVGSKEI